MISFQLIYECEDYSHGDVIVTSTDYDSVEKQFHEFLGQCLMDSVIDNNNVDYVAIETIDGEDDDEPVVALEFIFNHPK